MSLEKETKSADFLREAALREIRKQLGCRNVENVTIVADQSQSGRSWGVKKPNGVGDIAWDEAQEAIAKLQAEYELMTA